MTDLFEKLKKYGLIRRNNVDARKIANYSYTNLLNIIDEICELSSNEVLDLNPNSFIQTSSIALGGGRDDCVALECRLSKFHNLARYTTLYCDKIFIHNFISDYSPTFGHPNKIDDGEVKQKFNEDLILLNSIKPLIEYGLIHPFVPKSHYCSNCMARITFGLPVSRKLEKIKQELSTKILEDVDVYVYLKHKEFCIRFSSGKEYFGHNTFFKILPKIPKAILNSPRILKRLKNGEEIHLSNNFKNKVRLPQRESEAIIYNLVHQLFITDIFKTSYITNRDLDIEILNRTLKNDVRSFNNSLLAANFRAFIPFAFDVPIQDLLKLRLREYGSFIEFRNALKQAIREFNSDSKIDSKTIKDFYSDIIQPKLVYLDRKVSEAKKDISKSILSSVFSVVGILSFGHYSGFSSSDIFKIAELIGLSHIFEKTASKATNFFDSEKEVRNESFYFLWKVRKASRDKNFLKNKLF